jgi:hypothetical protein
MKRIPVFVNNNKMIYSIFKGRISHTLDKFFDQTLSLLNEEFEMKNEILPFMSLILRLFITNFSVHPLSWSLESP